MLHLDAEQVNETLAAYLKVVVQEVGLKKRFFVKFVSGITDQALERAF